MRPIQFDAMNRTGRCARPIVVLFESHQRSCTCSYCRGEHGQLRWPGLWIPQVKKNGWWVLHWPWFRANHYLRVAP